MHTDQLYYADDPRAISPSDRQTLVLTASDVRDTLGLADCIEAVERAFALHAGGKAPPPAVLELHVEGGGFHAKAASAPLGRHYFAAKTNANFPGNPTRNGLPTIQGVIVLFDATDGRPLAVLDSIEITTLRTGAATAVAAKVLAKVDSSVVTVIGCGVQGRVQLRSIAAVCRVERCFAYDIDASAANGFAEEMTESLGISVTAVTEHPGATLQSDIIVTCSPSTRSFLEPSHVPPGAFVAAVGADNPGKHELDPELFRDATVVVDSLEQCAAIGDLRHALDAGTTVRSRVHAELGQVVIGDRTGRESASEVILFDSTGTALQDVAAAALVYEGAVASGLGTSVDLSGEV